MQDGFEDVKTFLRNTREVVVWENNGFEQVWDHEVYMEFAELLVEEFGDWLVWGGDLGWNTTLEEAMAAPGNEGEGRLIITYNHRLDGDHYGGAFFPEVREEWGGIDEPDQLKTYLDGKVIFT